MPRHTLYAYVDGSDLHDVAPRIRQELEHFVDSQRWLRPTWVVDQMHPRDVSMGPEDQADWDLGLNHELPDTGCENDDWFLDVERIAVALDGLAAATQCEFQIGLFDNETGIGEDIYCLDGRGVDIQRLRAILGASPPSAETS